jgi:hypothetical protein
MGIIAKDYAVTGNKGFAMVSCLYDTGAGSSFVRRDIAEKLGELYPTPRPMTFTMADGQEAFRIDQIITLNMDVDDTPLMFTLYVADHLAEELIIGADLMQRWRISLDMEEEVISIDPRALYMRAPTSMSFGLPAPSSLDDSGKGRSGEK